MNQKYFTGIGSRQAPIWIISAIEYIAERLILNNFILRSGGADGMDTFWENSYKNGISEIYLPWKKFNGNTSTLLPNKIEAFKIAATIHPVWDQLEYGPKLLHARNCHQVLGQDLKTPSRFVLCWTQDAHVKGGTATAINLALNNNIPVLNFGRWTNTSSMKDAFDDFWILNGEENEI